MTDTEKLRQVCLENNSLRRLNDALAFRNARLEQIVKDLSGGYAHGFAMGEYYAYERIDNKSLGGEKVDNSD